ncbi:Actin-related protein Arp2/3 complex, subunit ARPC5 [Phaffia rhodozyma]|uniref:Actin-related protein 2/3 complex subunit 5 n=1 Tax=Phaffia rhodozyma TaxID=264483 RepID=A0A0F7ST66_PHARH|nr:Actin-related protein Arp2/3 complex, subunit ARPC5 [Phaffia rhodozyma]
MSDTAFRKINIDQYDEDTLQDSELFDPDTRSAEEAAAYATQVSTQVRQVLGRQDIKGALQLLLSEYPFGVDHDHAKATSLQTFVLILNSTKSTDITSTIKSLNPEEQDGLMKFIYKGMEKIEGLDVNPSVFLTWHEKLTEVAGVGSIVRVMTDRRTI